MSAHLFPLAELLPHTGRALWLDDVLDVSETECRTLRTLGREAMPAWFGLELMAQTISVHVSHGRRAVGMPCCRGYLLGTRLFECACSVFPAGARLEIIASPEFIDDSGISAFHCSIEMNGCAVANATLKVYETNPFNDALKPDETP